VSASTESDRRSANSGGGRRLYLDTPVTYLKGVGPARAEALRRLGITTAGDLLYHVPHRYEDASTITPIRSLEPGMHGTIVGTVISKGVLPTRKGLRIFQAVLRDETGMIEVSWPGQPFLDRTIDKGDVLLVTGNVRFFHGRQLQPREYVNLGDDEGATAQGRVLSVYPATEGLSFKVIRSIIDAHLDALLPLVSEYLPPSVVKAAGVPAIGDALRMMHRPSSMADAMRGRSRLAFEELFFVHLLHQRAKELAREPRAGIRFVNKRKLTTALREALPFELTGAQVRAIREIVADMCSDRRMQRLLQGDVGSGKTIVALFAAMLAIENGRQAAIMVPTELLAEQHAVSIGRLLAPLGIAPVLLTSRCSRSVRTRWCRRRRRSRILDSRRSTSSTDSASSSARRSPRKGKRRTCCSCRRRRSRARSRSRCTGIST
jgi:ATP-dependent DNA helicase RecG